MKRRYPGLLLRLGCAATAATLIAGCTAMDRLAEVGQVPELRPIENPVRQPDYEPVTLPMPRPEPVAYQPNSLWRTGAKAFFKDQRASKIGDILTVNIEIADNADLSNTTERKRTTDEDDDITTLGGYEAALSRLFPEAIVASDILDINGATQNKGEGTVVRDEEINLTIAALVTQVLPNGNLVLRGRQEIRVNYEVRELWITGVVRPEDITSSNTIEYDKIAEARIAYGGHGTLSDVQQPRYGTQILDIIYPF